MGKEERGWTEFYVFKCMFGMLQVEEKRKEVLYCIVSGGQRQDQKT